MGLELDLKNTGDAEKFISKSKEESNQSRKDDTFEDYSVLMGNQRKILDKMLQDEFPESFAQMRTMEFNFAETVVDKRAKIYKNGVIRRVLVDGKQDPEQQMVFDKVYEDASVNRMFKRANRLYELNKHVVPKFWIEGKTKKDITFKTKALPGYQIDIFADVFSNEQVVMLSHFLDETGIMRPDSVNILDEQVFYTFWTETQHFVVNESSVVTQVDGKKIRESTFKMQDMAGNADSENPFGFIPFIFSLKQETDGFYYPFRHGLARQSLDINRIITDVATIARNQGFGQATLIAPEAVMPQSVKLGTTTLIKIPMPSGESGGASFEFVTSNAPISEQMGMVKDFVVMLLDSHGLSSKGSGKLDANNVQAGISRLIQGAELIESIDETQTLFLEAEDELFHKIDKTLAMLKSKGQLPDRYSGYKEGEKAMTVEYLKAKPIQGDDAILNAIERKDELGLILPHEKHMIMDPNMTDKEAKEREKLIRQSKEEAMVNQQKLMSMGMGDENADASREETEEEEKEEEGREEVEDKK